SWPGRCVIRTALRGIASLPPACGSQHSRLVPLVFFFFKQKTAYEIGLGIPAEPLFRSAWVMLVLNLPFKALMFLTLMRPSLVLFLVLWLKLVKDFLKVRCRLALLPFLISCLIWLDLVASLPLIKE